MVEVVGSCPQVIQDLGEECGKFGQVLSVVVPRPTDPSTYASLYGQYNFGKVGNTTTKSPSVCHSSLSSHLPECNVSVYKRAGGDGHLCPPYTPFVSIKK